MDENILYQALNLHLNDNIEEAEKLYIQVLKKWPEKSFIYFLLGAISHEKNQFIEAKKYFNKAVKLNSNIDFTEDFSNKNDIIILLFMSIVKQDNIFSIENWEKALTLKPVISAAYVNTSVSYLTANDISNAHRVCSEGLELYPDNLDLRLNNSGALLRSNFIEQGWEFQESRIEIYDHHKLKFAENLKPKYDGTQKLKNKTIYVYHSAGFGDTIYFARYINLLAKKGANVIVKPGDSLVSLFKDSDFKAEIINDNVSDESIEFDYQIPFMSLGNAFKTSLRTIPFKNYYLKANKEKSNHYSEKYCNNEKLKIGIFWQGRPDARAFSLEKLLPIANIKNVQLFSFQKGGGIEQLNNLPDNIEIIDLGSTFNEFSDTAAAIDCMDLLIGCDTSISNLAAALGKNVWIALPHFSAWRWGLFSEKTAWYASARLFRQKDPNNWDEVFQRIYKKLEENSLKLKKK